MTQYDLGKRDTDVEKDSPKLRDFVEQLRDVGILNGALVTGTVEAGQQVATLEHGLGRVYVAALAAGTDDSTPLAVMTPQGTSDAGADPATYVKVALTYVAGIDVAVQIWIW